MINTNSIEEVNKSKYKEFTLPLYDSYCFSNIFGSIKEMYGIAHRNKLPEDVFGNLKISPNKVVFFFVDAFGWCFYDKFKEQSKFLGEIEKSGVVSKITSQFPSTTTAHVTTAISDQSVSEHGLYEWFYYEPEADDIITAFLFKEARNPEMEGLKKKNIDIKSFLPSKSFFEELQDGGVKSIVYQPSFINNSSYSTETCRNAELKGFEGYEDLFDSLSKDLLKDNAKEYYYVYLPDVDSAAHNYGNTSKEFKEAMESLLRSLDNFYEKGENNFKNTAVIISADHGQIDTDLNKKNYINEMIPGIEKYIKRNKRGELMCAAGYCRDMFIHVREEHLHDAKHILEEKLKGIAEVFTFEEFVEKGFFKAPGKKLKERSGNLILMPKGKQNVWWYEKNVFETNLIGVHGGASKDEMEIPFLFYTF